MAHDEAGSQMHDRIQELESRLQRMEHERTVTGRSRGLMDRIVPPEATGHFRAASKEQLMGLRVLVDHWIQRLDRSEPLPPAVGREDIPIE
jgi:hypothetical protein